MYACYYGHLRLVKMFIEFYSIDIHRLDKLKRNGFMLACGGKNINVIKYLLTKGVDVK